MDPRSTRRLRRWSRRHRTPLVVTGLAAVLVAVAGYLVVDAATTPVVGQDVVAPTTTGPAAPNPTQPTNETGTSCAPRVLTLSYSSDAEVTGAIYDTQEVKGVTLPVSTAESVDIRVCGAGTAVVFAAQAGYHGTTITCTVTEGQKVLATQTGAGAFGMAICTA